MRLKNLFKSIVISAAAMSVFAVPVLAANKSYSFDLYTDYSDNMYDYTEGNPKNDNEQAAYIYVDGGNITSSDEFFMTVYGMDHSTPYTYDLRVTSNNVRYVESYNRGNYAYEGQELCIKGQTYKYNVSADGHWYS